MQEAFLTVWRTAARFVPERAKASTWILTLVHRRAVDLVRREERRRTEPLATAPEPLAEGSAADEAWLRLRAASASRRRSASCRTQQREAIELAYYGGFHAVRAGRTARPAPGYHQEQDVRRSRAPARPPRRRPDRGREMETRGNPRPDGRVRAGCARRRRGASSSSICGTASSCQAELAALQGTRARSRTPLRRHPAAGGAARPHPRAARAERSNVVPLARGGARRTTWALAAARRGRGAAIGLGIWAAVLHSDLVDDADALANEETDALAIVGAPGTAHARPDGRGRDARRRADGPGGARRSRLPKAPAGKTYEAWVIRGASRRSAGAVRRGAGRDLPLDGPVRPGRPWR